MEMEGDIELVIQTDPVWLGLDYTVEWDNLLLLGDDCCVRVPTILLLGASSLARNMVCDLLPPFHSPITISVPTASLECLLCLKTILMNKGKSVVKEENILEKVKNLFTMLGIKAKLSCEKLYSSVHHGAPQNHRLRSNDLTGCDMTVDESTFMVNIKAEILDEVMTSAENIGDISIKIEQIEENTGMTTDIAFDELGEVNIEQPSPKENTGLTTDMAVDEVGEVNTEQPSPNLVTRGTTSTLVVQANSYVIEKIVDVRGGTISQPQYISSGVDHDFTATYNYSLGCRFGETAPSFHMVQKRKSTEDSEKYKHKPCMEDSKKIKFSRKLDNGKDYSEINVKVDENNIQVEDKNEIRAKLNQMIEKTEEMWKCKVCGKMSVALGNIKRHAETHIQGINYSCHICNKIYTTRNNLDSHISHIHPKLYSCGTCGKSRMNRKTFYHHRKRCL